VILDEPFTGLDKDGSALLMRMLADLKRRGAMVLMTSHDPQAALAVTDGFVRLSRGVLSEVVWVDGRGWSEIEPLLYDVSTPAFEEQSDAGETSRSKPALGQETGTIGTITTPSSDCLRPACGSGGRGVTEE